MSVRKAMKHTKEANQEWGHLAETMVKGGYWPEDRFGRAGIGDDHHCAYCGKEHSDLEHFIWDCPHWEVHRQGAGPEAQLARAARVERNRPGCQVPGDCAMYWRRGIVPWSDAYRPSA